VKKITLIVPDKIQHVIGSSRSRRVRSENLMSAKIINALCDRDDYHQYFYFESPDDVKVVSIVDYEEQ
jgi:transcriptional regulator of met regulon